MDTSETYIKMCDYEEIQALSPFNRRGMQWIEVGSWYAEGISDGDILCFGSIGADYKYYRDHRNKEPIWLPRQDQLQEIYLKSLSQDEQDSSNIMVVILDDFQDWVLNDCSGLDWSYGGQVSMEQLWLAFVMSELYQKKWDREDWI